MNQTQQITRESLQEAFLNHDPERIGYIYKETMIEILRDSGYDNFTEDEINEFVSLGDPTNSGVINYNDFILVLLSTESE